MGRVSKRVINKELQKELEDQLSFIISSLVDKNEINLFLDEFLTREEKIMLGKRLILYVLLYKGFTSTQIHNILGMSFETIRWYKEIYEDKTEVFKKQIDKLIKRERNIEFWKKVEKVLEPFALALEAKSNMKARAKLASGDFWKED